MVVGQSGAEGGLQRLFGAMGRLVEVPVRGGGPGGRGGGVLEAVEAGPVVGGDPAEDGLEGGDLGGGQDVHPPTLHNGGWPTVKDGGAKKGGGPGPAASRFA